MIKKAEKEKKTKSPSIKKPVVVKKKKVLEKKKEVKKEKKEEKKILKKEEKKKEIKVSDKYFEGIGRRKSSTARVRIYTKKKGFLVNGRDYKEYFPILRMRKAVELPFEKMNYADNFGVSVHVSGGGINSQADAIKLGISRALVKFNLDFKKRLRRLGLLTRDDRMVERKKYGLKKARRAPQWRKR